MENKITQSLVALPELTLLADTLNKSFIGKNLDFSFTSIKDAKLRKFLSEHLGTSALQLSHATVELNENSALHITGTLANKVLGVENLLFDCNLYGTSKGIEALAKFTHFPTTWKLSNAFGDLENSIHDKFKFQNVLFELNSVQINKLDQDFRNRMGFLPIPEDQTNEHKITPKGHDYFRSGWSFSGAFLTSDLPTAYQWLLADKEHTVITLNGPITFVNEQTEFWFQSLPGKALDFFGKSFPLHFGLISIRDTKKVQETFGDFSMEHFAEVYCPQAFEIKQSKTSIIGRVYYFSASVVELSAYFSEGVIVNVDDLLTLADAKESLASLSDLTEGLALTFKKISIDIDLHNQYIRSGHISLSCNGSVSLHEYFQLSGLDLYISTDFSSAGTRVFASSQLSAFDKLFDSSLDLPSKGFNLNMKHGETIAFDTLVSKLNLVSNSVLEKIVCTQFVFTSTIGTSDFSIFVVLGPDFLFQFGDISIRLRDTQVNYASTDQKNSVQLQGNILIREVEFLLKAYEVGNGWGFFVETLSETPILIDEIIQSVSDMFGIDAPTLPDVSLNYIRFTYNTQSKAFTLDANTTTALEVPFTKSTQSFDSIIHLETNDNNQVEGNFYSTVVIDDNNIQLKFSMDELDRTASLSWSKQANNSLSLFSVLSFMGIDDVDALPDGFDMEFMAISMRYHTTSKRLTLSGLTNSREFFYTWQKGKGASIAAQVEGMNLPYKKLSEVPGFSDLSFADSFQFDQLSLLKVKGDLPNYTFPTLPPVLVHTDDEHLSQGDNYAPVRPSFGDNTMHLTTGISFVIGMNISDVTDSSVKTLLRLLPIERITLQVKRSATSLEYYTKLSTSTAINIADILSIELDEMAMSLTLSKLPDKKPLIGLEGHARLGLFGNYLAGTIRIDGNAEETFGALQTDADQKIPLPVPFPNLQLIAPGISMTSNLVKKSMSMGMKGKLQAGSEGPIYDFAAVMETIGGVTQPQYISFYIPTFRIEDIWTVFLNGKPIPSIIKNVLSLIDVKGENIAAYWCDKAVQLPDGTQGLPGIQLGGMLSVYGFHIYGKFIFRDTNLGQSHFQLDPIDLPFLKITGTGEEIQEYSQQQKLVKVVDAGGPVFHFNATSLPIIHGSLHVVLLGVALVDLETQIDADGLAFEAVVNLLGAKMNLSVQVALPPTIQAHVQGEVDINLSNVAIQVKTAEISTLIILDLPRIHVSIHIQGATSGVTATASIAIELLGQNLNFNVDFNAGSDLVDIGALIKTQIIANIQGMFEALAKNAKDLLGTMLNPNNLLATSPVRLFAFELNKFSYADTYTTITQKELPAALTKLNDLLPSIALYGVAATKKTKTPLNKWVSPGINGKGSLSVYGINAAFAFDYANHLFQSSVQLSPITLGDVFSLKGPGKQQEVISVIDNKKHLLITSGGALITISAKQLTLKTSISLLGITQGFNLDFSKSICFDFKKTIFGSTIEISADFNFESLSLIARSEFDIELNDIRLVKKSPLGAVLGFLSINPKVSVKLTTTADSSQISSMFQCSFQVLGQHISHTFKTSEFTHIDQLKSLLSSEIAKVPFNVFDDLLSDPTKVAELIKDQVGTLIKGNIILNATNLVKSADVLKDIAELNYTAAITAINTLGQLNPQDAIRLGNTLFKEGPEVIIGGLKTVVDLSPQDAFNHLKSLKIKPQDVAKIAKDLYKLTPEDATKLLKGTFNVGVDVAGEVLKNVYNLDYKQAGTILKDIGQYSVKEISGVLTGTFGASKKMIGSIGGAFKSVGGFFGKIF